MDMLNVDGHCCAVSCTCQQCPLQIGPEPCTTNTGLHLRRRVYQGVSLVAIAPTQRLIACRSWHIVRCLYCTCLQLIPVALPAGANLENLSAELRECSSATTSEHGASRTASSDEADLVHHASDAREQLAAKPKQQPGSARASGERERERGGPEGRLHKVPHGAQQGAEQRPQGLLHVSADTRSQPLSPTQQPPTPQVQHGQRPPSQLGTSRPASVVAGSSEGETTKQIAGLKTQAQGGSWAATYHLKALPCALLHRLG